LPRVAQVMKTLSGCQSRLRPGRLAVQTRSMAGKPIGQEWDARIYRGVGPHPADPRTAEVAATVLALIGEAEITGEHVGSTAVPGLIGKNAVDLQVTADPAEIPAITDTLLGLGFARQRGRDPWPPERPMLEGTFRCHASVFLLHCHVVPATDPDVGQMTRFRDLLRSPIPRPAAYAADKRRITAGISDSLNYTHAKTALIRRLLGGSPTADASPPLSDESLAGTNPD